MKKELIFFLVALLILAAFGCIEENENAPLYDFFLFSNQKLSAQTYLYFAFEHMAKIMFAWLMWTSCGKYHNVFKGWFFICLFNAAQYLLKYDTGYRIGNGIFSSYVIVFAVMCILVVKEK